MFVTRNPQALPGTCIFCPGSARERYIDTTLHIELYGAIYICDLCVIEMGRKLDMLSKEQADALIEDMVRKDSEIFDLKRRVAGLEAAFRVMVDAEFGPVPEPRQPSVLLSDAEKSSVRASGGTDRMGEGTGTTSEPSHDEDVAGLRSNDDSNGSDFRLSI